MGPLFYPVGLGGVSPSATGPVSFGFTVGGCLLASGNSASGSFTPNAVGNYCGASQGTVSLGDHAGAWVTAGSMFLISPNGGVNVNANIFGVWNAIPDESSGESCLTGVTRFLLSGVLALV